MKFQLAVIGSVALFCAIYAGISVEFVFGDYLFSCILTVVITGVIAGFGLMLDAEEGHESPVVAKAIINLGAVVLVLLTVAFILANVGIPISVETK